MEKMEKMTAIIVQGEWIDRQGHIQYKVSKGFYPCNGSEIIGFFVKEEEIESTITTDCVEYDEEVSYFKSKFAGQANRIDVRID